VQGSQQATSFMRARSSSLSVRKPANVNVEEHIGSMGYGLIRSLYILIKEQPSLWYLHGIIGVAAVFGGMSLLLLAPFSRVLIYTHRQYSCGSGNSIRSHIQRVPDDR
jgi:hypothetical protein